MVLSTAQIYSINRKTQTKGSVRIIKVVFIPDMNSFYGHLYSIQEWKYPA